MGVIIRTKLLSKHESVFTTQHRQALLTMNNWLTSLTKIYHIERLINDVECYKIMLLSFIFWIYKQNKMMLKEREEKRKRKKTQTPKEDYFLSSGLLIQAVIVQERESRQACMLSECVCACVCVYVSCCKCV